MDGHLELGVGFEVRVALEARVELARVGLVVAARDEALVVEQLEHAVGLVLDQLEEGGGRYFLVVKRPDPYAPHCRLYSSGSIPRLEDARVVREVDKVPRDLLALVLLLLEVEDVVVELLLHLLVGVVDHELFERVLLEHLEAEDVEDADERVVRRHCG